MQYSRILHDPFRICFSCAAYKIIRIFLSVIIPKVIVDLQRPAAVKDIQHILIRQNQRSLVVGDKAENLIRFYLPPPKGKIDEQYAGIKIIVFGFQPDTVDMVGKFC